MTKRKAGSVDTDIIADNEAQMPQDLRKLAEKGKQYTKADANLLLDRYELGKLVAEATQNERKYGESAVRQLAIAWFGSPAEEALLQRCRVVATTYEKNDLQTLLKRQEQLGVQRLGWSHVDLLCQLQGAKAAKQRAKLENRVVDEGISVSNLRKMIIDLQGGKRSNGGRQSSMPRSPMAALQKLINEAQGLVNDEEVYDNYLFTPYEEMDDGDIGNADLLNQLNTAHETLEEALGVLTGQKEKLDQLIERAGALIGSGDGDDEDEDEDVAAADDDEDEEAPRKKTKKSKKGKKRRKAAAAV